MIAVTHEGSGKLNAMPVLKKTDQPTTFLKRCGAAHVPRAWCFKKRSVKIRVICERKKRPGDYGVESETGIVFPLIH